MAAPTGAGLSPSIFTDIWPVGAPIGRPLFLRRFFMVDFLLYLPADVTPFAFPLAFPARLRYS